MLDQALTTTLLGQKLYHYTTRSKAIASQDAIFSI